MGEQQARAAIWMSSLIVLTPEIYTTTPTRLSTMRNIIVASVLAVLSSAGVAQAATPGHTGNWNGAYLGLEAGYGWGSIKQPYGDVGGPIVSTEANASQGGGVVGGYMGYNWLFAPSWLVGVEGNMDWSGISGDDNGSAGDINAFDQQWEGSLRGRLGYLATPSVLLYMTGGYSWMDASLKAKTALPESHTATFDGWTLGGGAEWEIDPSMALRLQYRYTDYTSQRVSFPVNGYDIGATPSINTVTVGISFRL